MITGDEKTLSLTSALQPMLFHRNYSILLVVCCLYLIHVWSSHYCDHCYIIEAPVFSRTCIITLKVELYILEKIIKCLFRFMQRRVQRGILVTPPSRRHSVKSEHCHGWGLSLCLNFFCSVSHSVKYSTGPVCWISRWACLIHIAAIPTRNNDIDIH